MINSNPIAIAKIAIQWEGKWHLQIYTYDEHCYDYEEQHSEYCDTLQECYKEISWFQEILGKSEEDGLDLDAMFGEKA